MNIFSAPRKSVFGDRDWRVIEMAREDGRWSLNPNGLLARLARFLGVSTADGLADSKLEALRRFSVRAWYWDLIRTKDTRAFLEAGYSRIHVLEILSHVGMNRGFTPSIQEEAGEFAPTFRSGGQASKLSRRHDASHCRCG